MSSINANLSPARLQQAFDEAMTFQQFVEAAQVNQDKLRNNFESYSLDDEELSFFNSLANPLVVLVLAHDWCGDVVSNLPLFAKIEALTGKLQLNIINRDPHFVDFAEAFPHTDGKSRIPTYIFFNQAKEHIGTFIERPDVITSYFAKWGEQFWALHPELDGNSKPIAEQDEAVRKAYYGYLLSQRPTVQQIEKQGILSIIQAIVN